MNYYRFQENALLVVDYKSVEKEGNDFLRYPFSEQCSILYNFNQQKKILKQDKFVCNLPSNPKYPLPLIYCFLGEGLDDLNTMMKNLFEDEKDDFGSVNKNGSSSSSITLSPCSFEDDNDFVFVRKDGSTTLSTSSKTSDIKFHLLEMGKTMTTLEKDLQELVKKL